MADKLTCVVVTPEQTALETQAEFVAVPLYDGELGIGIDHAPLIGRLGFGEMRIRAAGGGQSSFYVDGGFVQVADNVVSILTNKAVPAEKVDASVAEKQLAEALKRPNDTEDAIAVRDRMIAQARAAIRVAKKKR